MGNLAGCFFRWLALVHAAARTPEALRRSTIISTDPRIGWPLMLAEIGRLVRHNGWGRQTKNHDARIPNHFPESEIFIPSDDATQGESVSPETQKIMGTIRRDAIALLRQIPAVAIGFGCLMKARADGKQPLCGCGRPLREGEARCPNCSWHAAARWKIPLKTLVMSAGSVMLMVIVGIFTMGRSKPRV
jgi:hypothetical protein